MHKDSFEALGTRFSLTIWDVLDENTFQGYFERTLYIARSFDDLYSRFKTDSLVTDLSTKTGVREVPKDLVRMLRLYEQLFAATKGALNPAVGFALADSGYDAAYSLQEGAVIRDTVPLNEALAIRDDAHIELLQPVLLDLGALGKGYLVDLLYEELRLAGLVRFLVDGSGDVRYHAEGGESIVCGLEHPYDVKKAIGTLALTEGSLCASATNRRTWGTRNHYIDPQTKESPHEVIATWVYAKTAALADGLSSALFFVSPEALADFSFEYCVVNKDLERKNSAGFAAEFFA